MPTIEELELTLPNGFHDARLLRLDIDYRARQATITLDVVVNEEGKPVFRSGVLRITGVVFLVLDPPAPGSTLDSSKPSQIDTGQGQPNTSPLTLPPVPPGHFLEWFFVVDWNSFIRVCAEDASFEWSEYVP